MCVVVMVCVCVGGGGDAAAALTLAVTMKPCGPPYSLYTRCASTCKHPQTGGVGWDAGGRAGGRACPRFRTQVPMRRGIERGGRRRRTTWSTIRKNLGGGFAMVWAVGRQRAACSVQRKRAARSVQRAACSVQRAASSASVQRAACSVQRAANSAQRAACSVQRTANSEQRAACSVQRAAARAMARRPAPSRPARRKAPTHLWSHRNCSRGGAIARR